MPPGKLPIIKKKNTSFDQFSTVRSIDGLVNQDSLIEFISYENRSRLLISSEAGYEWMPLPTEIQFGAIQDAILTDGNLKYVGNDFTLFSALGRSDANHSGQLDWSDDQIRWESIPMIDHKKDYRHIQKLDKTRYLVVANSSDPVIVTID